MTDLTVEIGIRHPLNVLWLFFGQGTHCSERDNYIGDGTIDDRVFLPGA